MICVSAGHGAIIHAATVEDSTLVGMGATILDGATVSACLNPLSYIHVPVFFCILASLLQVATGCCPASGYSLRWEAFSTAQAWPSDSSCQSREGIKQAEPCMSVQGGSQA